MCTLKCGAILCILADESFTEISFKGVLEAYIPIWIVPIGSIMLWSLYRIIERIDEEGRYPNTSAYASLLEITSYVWRPKRFIRFLMYGMIPPSLVFFLQTAVLDKTSAEQQTITIVLFLTAVLYYVPTQVSAIKHTFVLEDKIHRIIIILFYLSYTFIFSYLSLVFDFSEFSPSFSATVDGLWGFLFGSIIVYIYFHFTSVNKSKNTDRDKLDTKKLIKVVTKHIQKIDKKYGLLIDEMCEKYVVNPYILRAILVVEDINRPPFIRKIENIVVKFTRHTLSVGIAQVRSNIPLTDEESIIRAAKILHATERMQSDEEVFSTAYRYNQSREYSDIVCAITRVLIDEENMRKDYSARTGAEYMAGSGI